MIVDERVQSTVEFLPPKLNPRKLRSTAVLLSLLPGSVPPAIPSDSTGQHPKPGLHRLANASPPPATFLERA
jgi:hypothetical protein